MFVLHWQWACRRERHSTRRQGKCRSSPNLLSWPSPRAQDNRGGRNRWTAFWNKPLNGPSNVSVGCVDVLATGDSGSKPLDKCMHGLSNIGTRVFTRQCEQSAESSRTLSLLKYLVINMTSLTHQIIDKFNVLILDVDVLPMLSTTFHAFQYLAQLERQHFLIGCCGNSNACFSKNSWWI